MLPQLDEAQASNQHVLIASGIHPSPCINNLPHSTSQSNRGGQSSEMSTMKHQHTRATLGTAALQLFADGGGKAMPNKIGAESQL